MSVTCDLDDARWEQIAELLPAARLRGDQPPLVYRTILEGILSRGTNRCVLA